MHLHNRAIDFGDIRTLQQLGFSLDTYVSLGIALNVGVALVWFVVGGVLAWHKSDDWMALLVSLMLVSLGASFTTSTLLFTSSIWRLPANGLYLINLSVLFTFALFPNGRFVPRWIGWIALVYPATLMFYLVFLRQLHVPGWSLYSNPLNAFAWFGCLGALTLAQLYRYLRVSNQVERQQTKWVAFCFIVFGTSSFVGTAAANSLSIQQVGLLNLLIASLFTCLTLCVPFSFGVAILRYRLWDIDILINRTLVYGLLTAILALLYFGLVLGLQFLFDRLVGPTAANSPFILSARHSLLRPSSNPYDDAFKILLIVANMTQPKRWKLLQGVGQKVALPI